MRDAWDAVAESVNARMAETRMTQMELASRSGVSLATIREIQHNHKPRRRHPRTLAAISQALDWPPDQLERVLRGEISHTGEARGPLTEDPVMAELRAIHKELRHVSDRLDALERSADDDASP